MKPSTLLRRFGVVLALLCLAGPLLADESDFPLSPIRSPQAPTLTNSTFGPPALNSPSTRKHPLWTVASSLAIVLGGFLLLAAILRTQKGDKRNASELMETLGTFHVTPKVQLHLVRIGSRLLVLHVGAAAVECVAEITDPEEVQRLLNGQFGSNDAQPTSLVDSLDAHPQVHELLRSVGSGAGVTA